MMLGNVAARGRFGLSAKFPANEFVVSFYAGIFVTREDNLKGIRPKSQTLSELMTFIRQALVVKSFYVQIT